MGGEIQRFDECFSEVFSRQGWRIPMLPGEAEARWSSFVKDCVDGYPWDVEDYFNDLSLRSALAKALPELESAGHGHARELGKSIAESDEILKAVLVRDSFPGFSEGDWWLRRTPIYAARRFCAEFHESHGVEIASRSRYDNDVDEMSRMATEGASASSICFIVRSDSWYVSLRSGLFLRACRDALSLSRDGRKTVWKWLMGEISDDELRETFDNF
ncbi:hypothetical protein [Streptomyces sp. NPDC008139]|uniref:hypothetical protein n=1 Tax=Streptomyces sp. NPDC008139 TaxID=3364814 RepID=UPI0036F159AB